MKRKKDKLSSELLETLYGENLELFKSSFDDSELFKVDKNGKTLLHHAVLLGNIDLVKYLIAKGTNLNSKDDLEWTPLHYAVQIHNLSIVELLLAAGANSNEVDSYGNTVLWRAVFESKGRGEIISLLLRNNANPKLENNKGISPYKLAKTIANYNIVQYFE